MRETAKDDLRVLAADFLRPTATEFGKEHPHDRAGNTRSIGTYHWPGNVR